MAVFRFRPTLHTHLFHVSYRAHFSVTAMRYNVRAVTLIWALFLEDSSLVRRGTSLNRAKVMDKKRFKVSGRIMNSDKLHLWLMRLLDMVVPVFGGESYRQFRLVSLRTIVSVQYSPLSFFVLLAFCFV